MQQTTVKIVQGNILYFWWRSLSQSMSLALECSDTVLWVEMQLSSLQLALSCSFMNCMLQKKQSGTICGSDSSTFGQGSFGRGRVRFWLRAGLLGMAAVCLTATDCSRSLSGRAEEEPRLLLGSCVQGRLVSSLPNLRWSIAVRLIYYSCHADQSYNHSSLQINLRTSGSINGSPSSISRTNLSAKNSPSTSVPSLASLPMPFILSALHCPRQQPSSFHWQTPSPSRLSSWKWPAYRSPLVHLQTPKPCLWPLRKSPSYSSWLLRMSLPLPFLRSAAQWPWQISPLEYLQMPSQRSLLRKVPVNESPLKRFRSPSNLQLLRQVPQKIVPSLKQQAPCPSFRPYLKFPLQTSLLAYSRVPGPCGKSLRKQPEQVLPSSQAIVPSPHFTSCLNSPSYEWRSILLNRLPLPYFLPSFHTPWQYSSLLVNSPKPFF